MPPSVGNKKTKAVEQLLEELGVDVIPMPTEDICQNFNELRNQLLLLYELKQALASSEYDLQTLKLVAVVCYFSSFRPFPLTDLSTSENRKGFL